MAKILDGKKISNQINIKSEKILNQLGFKPHLAVVLVGENAPSEVYVKMKSRACEKLGLEITIYRLPESLKEKDIKQIIISLNKDENIHGIIVQLPLPIHINQFSIFNLISKNKDVDCFHPYNLGSLLYKDVVFQPCTASAVMEMLQFYKVPLIGKHVVVINDSILLGRPLAILLTNEGSTVTVCNKQTENIVLLCKNADIIVVGVGKRPDFVLDKKFCKKGSIIIDCGINKLDIEGKSIVQGDVDFDSVENVADMVSVVPGGVGKITISVLLRNVICAAKRFDDSRRINSKTIYQ